MRSVTTLIVIAALAGMLSLSAQTAPSTAGQPNMGQHRKHPGPKNLQVLPKDISSRDLIATMRGFTAALGVECSFCHAQNPETHRPDFASDAKPEKATARTMIRMVNEINSKYLGTIHDPDASQADKTVTCGTCHRGNRMPSPFSGSQKS